MSVSPVLYISSSEESTMISINRSIIDEIRDEIQLDVYYRRYEKNKLHNDSDFFDDAQSEFEYVFESFHE